MRLIISISLHEWAVELINKGKAYVDSQTSLEIADQKGTPTSAGSQSPFRDRPVEESLELFLKMKNGDFKQGEHVLRAKISMSSSNMLMRDPVIYRVINSPHPRTKTHGKFILCMIGHMVSQTILSKFPTLFMYTGV